MSLQNLPETMKQKNETPKNKSGVRRAVKRSRSVSPLSVIAVSAMSFLAVQSFAQTGFDFGLKGEFQSSSLVNAQDLAAGNELNFKDRPALAGGVGAGYSFTKHIGAEIDILYSPEGSEYTGLTSLITNQDSKTLCPEFQTLATQNNIPFNGNYTADVFLNYIKIPFLFRFNMNNTKRVFFSLFIGPQIDLLSSATIKINGQTASLAADNLTATDVYKKTEVDGVLGLGLGVNLTKNLVLTGHLRFDYGFGDAENKSETYSSGGTTYDFYNPKRVATNNATGGGMISLNYKLLKKEKEKKKVTDKKKSMSETDENNNDNNDNETKTETPTNNKNTTPAAITPIK
jgi:hypothetical protein